MNRIAFNDLTVRPEPLRAEIESAIKRVLDSGWFILGNEVKSFEESFAAYSGTRYCVSVASGTEAIALALMANGIGEGDEVITANLTAFPTVTGIMQAGAKPVVADVLRESGLLSPESVREKITSRTRAIVPVHLYGQCCDMKAITDLAAANNLIVVEDCAQSAGAAFRNKKSGAWGDCGAFSFYPTKNLGALGDAGAVTTDSREIYEKLLSLRNYGQSDRYRHDTKGINSRMDELQAAILNGKLNYLDVWNQERRQIVDKYRSGLKGVECMIEYEYGRSANHLFVIKSRKRDQLMEWLGQNGIQTLIHYPIPVNRQSAFSWQKEEQLTSSEELAATILSLPLYPGLAEKEIKKIIQTVNEFKS